MSTATLERMRGAIARLDKACGQSFIPDDHNCGKTPAQGEKEAEEESASKTEGQSQGGKKPKKQKKGNVLTGAAKLATAYALLVYAPFVVDEAIKMIGGTDFKTKAPDFKADEKFKPEKIEDGSLTKIGEGTFGEAFLDKEDGVVYKKTRSAQGAVEEAKRQGQILTPDPILNWFMANMSVQNGKRNEASAQYVAGQLGVAPKLYGKKGNVMAIEYLKGYKTASNVRREANAEMQYKTAEALAKLHIAGISHNDLDAHQNNIMYKEADDGRISDVKLIDFGQAKFDDYDSIAAEAIKSITKRSDPTPQMLLYADSLPKEILKAKTKDEKRKLIADFYERAGILSSEKRDSLLILKSKFASLNTRLDKECGNSYISENEECHVGKGSSKPKAKNPEFNVAAGVFAGLGVAQLALGVREIQKTGLPRTSEDAKRLATIGGMAVMAATLAVVSKSAYDIHNSGISPEDVTPKKPKKGYYDSLRPGDLLYTSFRDEAINGHRAHYAVYLGKAEGKHMITHLDAKTDENGQFKGSHITTSSIDDYPTENSFKKASRTKDAGKSPTTEQLHKLVEQLNGKEFRWDGFKENCESYARALVNDVPRSIQGDKVNALTKELVSTILTTVHPVLGGKGKLKGKDVKAAVKRVVGDGLYVDVTPDVFPILRSVYGAGIQKVLSAQLDGENIIGIFRGSPRPGESRYYNYTLSTAGGKASVRYKQSVRGDAADKPCDCEECKEKKRIKSECGCKSDGITKTHAVMREFRQGKLKSSSGDKVTDRKQAIAIALSEEERMKRRKKKSDSGDSLVARLRAAIATLDAKCGKGGISQGESCHIGSGDKSIHEAIGMGASVLSGGALDKLVMQKHGVNAQAAREFSQSLNAVFRQGGGMAARKHYEAWSRHIVKTAKTMA